jgi:hypothetical protein
VVEHLGELATAREHDAHAARDEVVEALERIEVAERAYAEVEQFYAQRVLERGIPDPLPRSLFPVEEDPTIKSAA